MYKYFQFLGNLKIGPQATRVISVIRAFRAARDIRDIRTIRAIVDFKTLIAIIYIKEIRTISVIMAIRAIRCIMDISPIRAILDITAIKGIARLSGPVISKYYRMDPNKYQNIFGCQIVYRMNIRIYLDVTNLPNEYPNIF